MARIKGKNTKPEILVRSMLHKLGYRFRIHNKQLPGKPDIVLPKYKTVILVHGCFSHRHEGCSDATTPKSNTNFWLTKFQQNILRDNKTNKQLRDLGWDVIIVWECELRNASLLSTRLDELLSSKI